VPGLVARRRPVVAAVVWLGMVAEYIRYDKEHVWGAVLDMLKFLFCMFRLPFAWRSSENAAGSWRGMRRAAIALSMLFAGLTYRHD